MLRDGGAAEMTQLLMIRGSTHTQFTYLPAHTKMARHVLSLIGFNSIFWSRQN